MVIDAQPDAGWTVILPLKGGAAAKSRLGRGPDLARAIALDCLDAVLACPAVGRVLVVTADGRTAADAAEAGAEVVPEHRPGSGLVAAVRDGLAAAARPDAARLDVDRPDIGRPDADRPVAVLLGDLPALRPHDLAVALGVAGRTLADHPDAPMAALPDAEGSGTVLLAGRRPADLDPAFGPASLAEHRLRGAVVVALPPDPPSDPVSARLRHDVDTPADLGVALALGAGPRTAALASRRSAS